MPFNGQHEFQCKVCTGKLFSIAKGTTCIYLICTKCESTDEISRRHLGWDDDGRKRNPV